MLLISILIDPTNTFKSQVFLQIFAWLGNRDMLVCVHNTTEWSVKKDFRSISPSLLTYDPIVYACECIRVSNVCSLN